MCLNISLLKSDLLAKDALTSYDKFMSVRQKLRNILQLPDLQAGILICYRSITLETQNIGKSLVQEEHIQLAKRTLMHIHHSQAIPIADYYVIQLETFEAKVRNALNSGDETEIIDCIRTNIEPLFKYIEANAPELSGAVNAYYQELCPTLGIYYRERKKFEDSVTMLNDTIAAFIDQEDAEAQRIFPHYFEKYKTDGVEFDMYVGDSLVKHSHAE